ncbi:hypothetical protein ScPMuIL_005058 [Solemya velum]
MDLVLKTVLLSVFVGDAITVSVRFPSGQSLTVIDPSTLENPSSFEDPKDTGSHLYQATGKQTKLSLNIRVADFKSSSSEYFRADPTFIRCVQKTLTYLQNNDKAAYIISGFMTSEDAGAGTKVQALYGRSGCGVQLGYKEGVTADVREIAHAALLLCPTIFEAVQRDVGVVLMADRVHLHMTGGTDTEPYFQMDGYTAWHQDEFLEHIKEYINEGIVPVGNLDCSSIPDVETRYPTGAVSPESVVGAVDYPITRQDEEFKKLVQYQGYNDISFLDTEHLADWCGTETVTCVDCTEGPQGNSVEKRCADRVMSARMYNVIRRLQKLAVNEIHDSLVINDAWDEPYEGKLNGDWGEGSLHTEGRAVTLQRYNDNNEHDLKELARLAVCAGVDYVEHKGDYLLLAVKKMKGAVATTISFPNVVLLSVDVPTPLMAEYKLPSEFDDEADNYPLFDSDSKGDTMLGNNAFISQFVSRETNNRYFRLRPIIVRCYSLLVYQDNKYLTEGAITIKVLRGFLTNQEQRNLFDPLFDKRYNIHLLGEAMQIAYGEGTPDGFDVHRLAQNAIDKCGPIFEQVAEKVAVGIYKDSVYVGVSVDGEFSIWLDNQASLPPGVDMATYKEQMETRYDHAIAGRVVDPDSMAEACSLADPPQMQSVDYEHKHPELLRRRKRQAPDPNECVPRTDTKACIDTAQHRTNEVNRIQRIIERKHLPKKDIETALSKCFGICGTCLQGSIYEDKVEHCNNLLHWVPFGLKNEAPDVTNFYSRDNMETRRYACEGGGHCIEKSPLFAVIADTVDKLYRPDPTKSVKEALYDSIENPLPAMRLLNSLYAIHAAGVVKFWVKDESDITSMKDVLKVNMLYNTKVSKVQIYVTSSVSKKAVYQVVQGFSKDWATSGCPSKGREFITPFEVLDVPVGKIFRNCKRFRTKGSKREEKDPLITVQW